MVVLRPAAPPPNPAAIHELKSRSMSLFRLWLREGLPPLPAFLLKHQVLLQAPISLAPEPGRPLPPPPPGMAAAASAPPPPLPQPAAVLPPPPPAAVLPPPPPPALLPPQQLSASRGRAVSFAAAADGGGDGASPLALTSASSPWSGAPTTRAEHGGASQPRLSLSGVPQLFWELGAEHGAADDGSPAASFAGSPATASAAAAPRRRPEPSPLAPPSSSSSSAAYASSSSGGRDWLSQLSSQRQQASTLGGARTAADARNAAGAAKRGGGASKRRIAEAVEELREGQLQAHLQLELPSAADCAALATAWGAPALVLLFHFADGGSSARPSVAAIAAAHRPFDPRHTLVGVSVHARPPGGAPHVVRHLDLRPAVGGELEGGAERDDRRRRVARCWEALRRVLCHGRAALIVPNLQVVLRGLLAAEPALGDEVAMDRVMDPVVAGWLCAADSTDEMLELPRLCRLHAKAGAAPWPAAADTAAELAASWDVMESLWSNLQTLHGGKEGAQTVLRREMRATLLLASMELEGMGIAPDALLSPGSAVDARLVALQHDATRELGGHSINLASAQQLSEALYVRLQLPKPRGGDGEKAGHGSTSSENLEKLAKQCPSCRLVGIVLEFRELTKLKTTFLEPYHAKLVGGRLHAQWCGTATGTGRLSSRHPNLQQVPRGATRVLRAGGAPPLDVSVRAAFVARPGKLLLAADYKQLEMRLFASFSGDPTLQRELGAGGDLFVRVAAAWNRKGAAAVTADERGKTKQLCYGLLYGMGVEKLGAGLGVSAADARHLKSRFLEAFPGLGRYIDELKRRARQTGRATTYGGRIRPLPAIRSSDGGERTRAERQAVNSVLQGSAADVVKEAMLACRDGMARAGLRAVLLAQIHDELIWEVDADAVADAARVVRERMERLPLRGADGFGDLPPLPVSVVAGPSWGEMVAVE